VGQPFNQERTLDRPHPIDVLGGFHPAAKIEAAGILINPRLTQAHQHSDDVAVLKTQRVQERPIPRRLGCLKAQPHLPRQIVRSFPALGALCFKVELKPVSSANGCGDDLPLQADRVLKINPPRRQFADMVGRESVREQAAGGSARGQKAG
jgi:hypothetical protein